MSYFDCVISWPQLQSSISKIVIASHKVVHVWFAITLGLWPHCNEEIFHSHDICCEKHFHCHGEWSWLAWSDICQSRPTSCLWTWNFDIFRTKILKIYTTIVLWPFLLWNSCEQCLSYSILACKHLILCSLSAHWTVWCSELSSVVDEVFHVQ